MTRRPRRDRPTNAPPDSPPVEIHLDSFAFGGEALGRLDGRVTFVPYGLPEETVRARVVQDKKDYARAELIEVVDSSPDRTEPVCPMFGVCGGCQLQHATYDAQLEMKRQMVVEQLRRIGGFEDAEALTRPTIGMISPWEYRNHARFSVGRRHGELGFTQRNTRRLLRIEHCYLMHPGINEVLHELQGRLPGFSGHQLAIRVGANTNDRLVGPPLPDFPEIPSGQTSIDEEILNRRYRVAAAAFFQVNTRREQRPLPDGLERCAQLAPQLPLPLGEGSAEDVLPLPLGEGWGEGNSSAIDCQPAQGGKESQALFYLSMADILALLVFNGLDPRPNDVVLDAYCGVGTFSILLAPHVQQGIGIEESAAAIEDARRNADDLSNVTFHAGKVEKLLGTIEPRPTIVVLDPARVGCELPALDALAAMAPRGLVYVSCDPATLSRDLAILRNRDYTLESVQPLDMFPQTSHVECVAVLRR
ncbi:MAG TPA: class I SAM-dependent RNA methyltransferase [Chloroflexota bacterium]|nr:class I SAM-dependent RNA methyltransferase [Chloroflexota bacterium]